MTIGKCSSHPSTKKHLFEFTFFSIFYLLFFIIVVIVYKRIACMSFSASRGQKKVLDPWNWNYGHLLAAMWVLGIEPRSSERAASAVSH